MNNQNTQDFINGFWEALFWSELDDNDQPFDDNYDETDLDNASREDGEKECIDFLDDEACQLIESVGMDYSQAGHDFCLTRNGHGAGFWDRGLGEVGERLSDMCKPYGTINLYLAGDGTVATG